MNTSSAKNTQSDPALKANNAPNENQKNNKNKNKKKKSLWARFLFWTLGLLLMLILMGALAVGFIYFYYEKELPDVRELKNIKPQAPLQILSKEGELMAVFGEKRRDPLSFEQIPPRVIEAFVATEDARFYEHNGIDPIGIFRAFIIGIENKGKFSQGGSTITQQVAKNYFLNSDKKFERKIKEAILALRMEKELSKNEIMTIYLNMIYFGSRSYGIGAAAYTFFGKKPDELTISEAALLAGLPNAPSAYNPIYSPEKALTRRNWVLHRMLDQKMISQAEYQEAVQAPLGASLHHPVVDFSAPYVAEMARQYAVNQYGEDVYDYAYKVYTTISRKEQLAAESALVEQLISYDHSKGYRGAEQLIWQEDEQALSAAQTQEKLKAEQCFQALCPAIVVQSSKSEAQAMLKSGEIITLNLEQIQWAKIKGVAVKNVSDLLKPGQLIRVVESEDKAHQKQWILTQLPLVEGAFVALNDETGAIDALVGGFDFNRSKFNRATQAIRQIGSTIKPFIYAATLENGLTLGSILNDTPITRSTGTALWRPKNDPDRYQGPMRLRTGMALSKNVMMVRAMRSIGIQTAADYLLNFGFPKENISYNESLALGAASFTPLQVARAYSVIANGGYLITPYIVEKIAQSDEMIYEHQPQLACVQCEQAAVHRNLKRFEFQDAEAEAESQDENELPDDDQLKADEDLLLATQTQSGEAPRVINQDVAFLIKDAMRSVIFGDKGVLGTAWRSKSLNRQDIGGKTGTTNGSKDVWFAGYLGNRVAVVWMGFDDHRKALRGASGGKTANPVWNKYMEVAKEDIPVQKTNKPRNVIGVKIDAATGFLASGGNNAITEYYIKGTEPTTYQKEKVSQTIVNEAGEDESIF